MNLLMGIIGLTILAVQTPNEPQYVTDSFRIRYYQRLSSADIDTISRLFEKWYRQYRREYDLSLDGRLDVYLVPSYERFRAVTKSTVLKEGIFRNGKVYLVVLSPLGESGRLGDVISRVLMRALLEKNLQCPKWLAEAYSLYLGNSLDQFGRPAQSSARTFEDLNEEFSRASTEQRIREVYAKLAATAHFFSDRYGRRAFKSLILECKTASSLGEAMRNVFRETLSDIEKAWMKAIYADRLH